MKYLRCSVFLLLLVTASGFSSVAAAGRARQSGAGKEELPQREDPERAITGMIRQMQMDLEGASSRGFLSHIDAATFDDYPRFEDMIDRLTRENSLRVYFRQVSSSVRETSAQTVIDAEMEMTRKDSAIPGERRRQQLILNLEQTRRGWKIVSLSPREFFRPL